MDRDIARLDRLGIFSSIDILPEAQEDGVRLRVELVETIWLLPYPSFNYTDENGASAGVGAKATSLFGRATSLSVSGRFGGLKEVEVLFRSPALAKNHLWYAADYYYRDRANALDFFREHARELDARVGWQLREDLRVGGRLSFMSMATDVNQTALSSNGRDNIPGIGLLAEYDTRDLRSNAHRGWWNSVDFTKSGGSLGGPANFLTANLDFRRFQPIADRHTIFFASLVTFQTGAVGQELPIYRDFQIGGTNTVRGWHLGAREGKNQLIDSLEYRYELLKPKRFSIKGFGFYAGLQVAAFADVGTAWNTGDEFTKNFIGGGGVGIRLIVPFVDMLRLDFGFGQSGIGIVRHIGIREKAQNQRLRVR